MLGPSPLLRLIPNQQQEGLSLDSRESTSCPAELGDPEPVIEGLLAPDMAWVVGGLRRGVRESEALVKWCVTPHDHTTCLHYPSLCCGSQTIEVLEQSNSLELSNRNVKQAPSVSSRCHSIFLSSYRRQVKINR